MRQVPPRRVLTSAAVATAAALAGCKEAPTVEPPLLPPVQRVVVSPANAALQRGDTLRFVAEARDALGAIVTGFGFAWTSSNTASATVDAAGLVTAGLAGTALITAWTQGRSNAATVTVISPHVIVSPASDTMPAAGGTLQFTAEYRDVRDSVVPGVTFTWSSSNGSVATVASSGLVTGRGRGTATITARANGITGSASVTIVAVVASVRVTPVNPVLFAIGQTVQLAAQALDASDQPIADVVFTWSTSDSTKVTVTQSGLATAVGLGPAAVTARLVQSGAAFVVVGEPLSLPPGRRLDSGDDFTCALEPGGAAWTWGRNAATPLTVRGSLSFQAISVAGPWSCAVTSNGSAFCWWGTSPAPVAGSPLFQSVAVGDYHICGLDAGGTAYCWGRSEWGKLGDGTYTDRATPTPVAAGLVFKLLAAGRHHTCGLTADGTAYCWGRNREGQLGDGTTTTSPVPVRVAGGLRFTALSGGLLHTCGLSTSGAAYCWGYNSNGQLGDLTGISRSVPTPVFGGLTFRAIEAGYIHTCGLTTTGAAYCWGDNASGQVGVSWRVNRALPEPVSGGLLFSALSVGRAHSCGIALDGTAYCWGSNQYGQLGNGSTGGDSSTPVAVTGNLRFGTAGVRLR